MDGDSWQLLTLHRFIRWRQWHGLGALASRVDGRDTTWVLPRVGDWRKRKRKRKHYGYEYEVSIFHFLYFPFIFWPSLTPRL
jgi:hypothetical protein